MIRRAVMILLATGLLTAGTVSGVGSVLAQPAPGAVDRFGSCVAAAKSAQVLILIDTSGSLTSTDPQAARVTAAKYLVSQLTHFATESGAAIDVAVAGFADHYQPEIDWTPLNEANLTDIEVGLDNFAKLDTGADTDYWEALNGARAALSAHRLPEEAQSCQALAWFTDGKIDYSQHPGTEKPYALGHDLGTPEGVRATVAAAQESLCRPGGVADQLRSSGIVTFGIGLAPETQTTSDFDVLKAIVSGEPTAAGPCGNIQTPTPGAFYLASNIDDLLFAFDAFSTPGQPPQLTESGVCPGTTVCEDAKHRFTLDRSVRSVNVLASADYSGLIPVLVPPMGPPHELRPGTSATLDVEGVAVDYRWLSEKSLTFRMTNSQAPVWQGQWALVFEDPSSASTARTKTSIHISGDLFPSWPQWKSVALHQDETIDVTFAVVDGRGSPVNPETLLGQAELSVVLVDAAGATHPVAEALPKDQVTTPHRLDLHGIAPGKATLRMTLTVTTAGTTDQSGAAVVGTRLSPQSVDLPLVINPPVGYPRVGPSVDFGLLSGAGSVQRGLPVTGPGCVFLPVEAPVAIVAAPDGVGDITISSTAQGLANCIKVADGQNAELPLTLTVPQQGNGAINGTITVTAIPADGGGSPVTIDVPFTLTAEKQLNKTSFALTLIIALLLGPGIPISLLYLTKWWVARIPGKALRAEQIPVQIRNGTVLRNNQRFKVADSDLVHLVQGLQGPTRRLDIGGVELITKVGLSPFGAGFVVANAGGLAGCAGKAGNSHGMPPTAKLPLAVHNTWFVLHDPTGPQEAATVVLLVGGDAGRPVLDRLSAEINEALPRLLPDLRRRALPPSEGPSSTPVASHSPNPFAGGTAAAPAPTPGNPFTGGAPTPANDRGPFGGRGSTGSTTSSNPFGNTPASSPNGNPIAGNDAAPNSPFGSGSGSPDSNPFGSPGGAEPPNPFRPN